MKTTTKMQCITCKQVLPLSKFRRYKKKSGFGYRRYCRKCEAEASDLRYHHKKNQSNIEKKMKCNDCKQFLPISKFRKYNHRFGDSGYRGSCRECEAKTQYLRYHKKKKQLNIEKKVQKKSSVQDGTVLFMNWVESNNISGFDVADFVDACQITRGLAEKIIYKQICKGYLNQMGANNFVVNMGEKKRAKI